MKWWLFLVPGVSLAQVCAFPPCYYDQTTIPPFIPANTYLCNPTANTDIPIACTPTSTLPPIAANSVLGNPTGSIATPIAIPLGMAIGDVPILIDFDGSGSPGLQIPNSTGTGLNFRRTTTGATNTADFFVHRSANYVGGDNTKNNAAFLAKTITTSGANSYEWTGTFIMDNSNTLADASQNLALAAVAFKRDSGLTWARYAELDDDLLNSTGGAVTDEVDLFANGTQGANNRFIMHLVSGPKNYPNSPAHIEYGIKFSPQNNGGGGTANAVVDDAWLGLTGDYKYGIHLQGGSSVAGSAALRDDRTGTNLTYGLVLQAPYVAGAIYLADNKNVIWSSNQHTTTVYIAADGCLEHREQTIAKSYDCNTGQFGVGTVAPNGDNTAQAFYVGTSANTNAMASPYTLYRWGVPVALPSSGSFANNGALTLTTALPNNAACSATVGCYMYFPANAIVSGGAAGLYFTQCSSTTACTVFNNTYTTGAPTTVASPTAFSVTGPGAYTQTTASDLALLVLPIPADSMGANGSIEIQTFAQRISNANTVVEKANFNGVAFATLTALSQQWYGFHRTVLNLGDTQYQVALNGGSNIAGENVAANSAPSFLTTDTTATKSIAVTMALSTAATDWVIIYGGYIMVNYAP